MRGNIDVLRRMSEGVVSMTGWAADTRGDATPLDILVFVEELWLRKHKRKANVQMSQKPCI
jgi:hypothetical protein